MSKGIHLKYDAEGDMAEAVEILKIMGIPIRSLMREAIKKEAAKWQKIAEEVKKGTPE